MNYHNSKAFFLSLLFISLACSTASAILSDTDKQLNKNIKTFTPIYCGTSRIAWEYWGKKYEFVISLDDDEKLPLKPPSDLSNEFLGYKNKNTKLKVLCNRLDSVFNRLISSNVIATFDIDDLSKKIVYSINGLGPHKKVEITVSIARDMHNIEIIESRTNLRIFKKYKPVRIFNVSFSVKDSLEANPFLTLS